MVGGNCVGGVSRVTMVPDAPAPRRSGVTVEIVVALALAAFTLPLSIAAIVQFATEVPAWVPPVTIVLVGLLHAVSLFVWRWPAAALAAGAVVMLALAWLPFDATASAAMLPSSLAFLLIVLTAARADDVRVGRAALVVGIVGALIMTAAHRVVANSGPLRDDLMIQAFAASSLVAAVVAAWALGRLARMSRLRERERERDRIREAISAERRRISRDLHDVIAHSMTVMIAQAEAGGVLARGDPDAAAATLDRIGEQGREALRDLRAMLRVLDDDVGSERAPAPLAPTPGIDGVQALVERARADGRELSFSERGERRSLARDAELAAYRAVQEGVTNAIRHTRPPVRLLIELDWSEDALRINIADDGGARPVRHAASGRTARPFNSAAAVVPTVADGGHPPGRGLIGMRERVERAGGQLTVTADRGWTVAITLPTVGAQS